MIVACGDSFSADGLATKILGQRLGRRGAGGVRAGVFYKGAAPILDTLTRSTFLQGKGGDRKGGMPGTNDGVDGPTGVKVLVQ